MPVPSLLLEHLGPSNAYIVRYWDELNEEEQSLFEAQLLKVDFVRSKEAFDRSAHLSSPPLADLAPLPDERLIIKRDICEEERKRITLLGFEAISKAEVALIVLAGGQASRLGSDKPKGMVQLGLNMSSHDTLFGLQAAKISRLERLVAKHFPLSSPSIPWIVMTSSSTHDATVNYLDDVMRDNPIRGKVSFICQEEMPAFDFEGRFILAEKGKLATSPNGNGGLYSVLAPELEGLEKRGVKYVHVYCVDNILCKVADPFLVGLAVERNADCIAKTVQREDPKEKVGVICINKGVPSVVEYSELGELADLRLNDGRIAYRAGNIANHFFSLDFLKNFCTTDFHLPFHRAYKKIPFVDNYGEVVRPTENNGVKLEQFVFDVFPFSHNFFALEVPRDEEFSPLKNPDSTAKECLSTCREDVYSLHKKWLCNAGAVLDERDCRIVVNAIRSYDGEGLEEFEGMSLPKEYIIS